MSSHGVTHVYPSGLTAHLGKSKSNGPIVIEHVAEVAALYHKVRNRTARDIPFDDVLAITSLAKRLLTAPNFQAALTSNYMVSGNNDFLVDSLNFSVTGKRTISLATMMQVFERQEIGATLTHVPFNTDMSKLHENVVSAGNMESLLLSWANQPNGVYDILCTLKLLF